jgi:HD superfamily phosphohydrolase
MMETSLKNPVVYVLERLVLDDKTIRDPIHGDIILNHVEVSVIDTELFQRLRRIRQLGTAHFVYPGAEHSRFQHSIGTLHMSHVLLRNIRENRLSTHREFGDKAQDMFFTLTVRLAALIHDLQEYPLSHVLEKEGRIFEKQWQDTETNTLILGIASDVFKAIHEKIVQLLKDFVEEARNDRVVSGESPDKQTTLAGREARTEFDEDHLARKLTSTILAYSYKIVKSPKEKIGTTARRFFGDDNLLIDGLFDEKYLSAANQIVSNTISADLLDYAARDFLFCGIDKTYDERFLKYAAVMDSSEGPVFAYQLISKRNDIKASVLSSLFDVLELRYSLAEFVHTHRTKNAFSAMAIEAFSFYYHSLNAQGREDLIKKMMWMGDDELLSHVRTGSAPSRHILNYYFSRSRYSEQILWSEPSDVESEASRVLWNAEERMFLERCLVRYLREMPEYKDVEDGDVLIYAMPSPKELYKELDTFVVYFDENGKPKSERMSSIAVRKDPYPSHYSSFEKVTRRIEEKRKELIEKYQHLWRTTLYLSPRVNASPSVVATLIEHLFQLVHPEKRGPQKELIPSELYANITKLAQGQHRKYESFKELFKSLD